MRRGKERGDREREREREREKERERGRRCDKISKCSLNPADHLKRSAHQIGIIVK